MARGLVDPQREEHPHGVAGRALHVGDDLLPGEGHDMTGEPRAGARRKQPDTVVDHLDTASVDRRAAQRDVHAAVEPAGGASVDGHRDEALPGRLLVQPAAERRME